MSCLNRSNNDNLRALGTLKLWNLWTSSRSITPRCQCHNTACLLSVWAHSRIAVSWIQDSMCVWKFKHKTVFWGVVKQMETPTITVFGGNQLPVQLPYNKTCKYHEESQIRKVTKKKGWEMHNKLVGTKEFGRTIRIHNTPLPPRSYAQSFASFHTRSFTTYRLTHKADKTTATWTH